MGTITVRPIEKEDIPFVQKIGRKAFTGMESLMVPKSKAALVAEQDGKIMGAVLYKFMRANGQIGRDRKSDT